MFRNRGGVAGATGSLEQALKAAEDNRGVKPDETFRKDFYNSFFGEANDWLKSRIR